jgi:7,8-dihydropterin-6-yl-methyl-4-(beta-D-ribofuranosyl)aminobenzene 5'-phosphate synthase
MLIGGRAVSKVNGFGEAQTVAVTILVDNRADLIVESTETVKYFRDKPLLAEHGFAALIDLKAAGIRILWDAGITRIALLENMKQMQIDAASIDTIAISHGHRDHIAAVTDILAAMDLAPKGREWPADASIDEIVAYAQGRQVPLILHPAAFRERWAFDEDGKKHGPHSKPPRAEWEAAGAKVITSEGPCQLGPGCWTTGYVPRRSFEKSGRSTQMYYRDGHEFRRDDLDEDQAIVINVKGKGLVVVSGCAHSGIVNTVRHAQQISGVGRVWAILGGFHLARAKPDEVQRTIDAIKALQSRLIVPSHCTGFAAIAQFAAQMPDVFLPGVVGATYLF